MYLFSPKYYMNLRPLCCEMLLLFAFVALGAVGVSL